jgi:hypothetical protein
MNCGYLNIKNKENPINHCQRWPQEEEEKLLMAIDSGFPNEIIAETFGRSIGGITSRIRVNALRLYKDGKTFEEIKKITKLSDKKLNECISRYDNTKKNLEIKMLKALLKEKHEFPLIEMEKKNLEIKMLKALLKKKQEKEDYDKELSLIEMEVNGLEIKMLKALLKEKQEKEEYDEYDEDDEDEVEYEVFIFEGVEYERNLEDNIVIDQEDLEVVGVWKDGTIEWKDDERKEAHESKKA